MEEIATSADGGAGTSAAGVLADARELVELEQSASAALLRQAVLWADLHPALDPALAARWVTDGYQTDAPLAGAGTPDVDAASVAEFAVAIGRSTESGQQLIGDALELRHRLPRVWAMFHAGAVRSWFARRIAQRTRNLSIEATHFVDAQIAAVAGRCGLGQLDRLVEAAITEFMPAEAERLRQEAAEKRHFTVHHPGSGEHGLSTVEGRLDLADALDLDAAVGDGARALADAGCDQSLDVRRSMAVGELARRQPALDLSTHPDGLATPSGPRPGHATSTADGGSPTEPAGDAAATGPADDDVATGPTGSGTACGLRRPHRTDEAVAGRATTPGSGSEGARVVLYLHLSVEALGRGPGQQPDPTQVGWVENTRTPVTAGQIRDWCARPGARVSVKPVIDLDANLSTPGYAIPDWLREQVCLRNPTCVFPWCSRPAHPRTLRRRKKRQGTRERKRPPDLDHDVPYDEGGATESDNLAPLCRRHHNLKTHFGWRYRRLGPDTFEWTSPHGLRYRRDRDGTTDLNDHPPDRPPGRHPDDISPRPPPPKLRPIPRSRMTAWPPRAATERAPTAVTEDEPPPF